MRCARIAVRIVKGQQLSALAQRWPIRIMRLHVQQKPASAENVRSVDDSRSFFIGGEEGRPADGKSRRIMLGNELQRVGSNVILPDLRKIIVVPRILFDQNVSMAIDGHVVQHVNAFGPV